MYIISLKVWKYPNFSYFLNYSLCLIMILWCMFESWLVYLVHHLWISLCLLGRHFNYHFRQSSGSLGWGFWTFPPETSSVEMYDLLLFMCCFFSSFNTRGASSNKYRHGRWKRGIHLKYIMHIKFHKLTTQFILYTSIMINSSYCKFQYTLYRMVILWHIW